MSLEPFQRFTAPDPAALEREIERARASLSEATKQGDALATIEHAADLAGMLTTARRESEAHELLLPLEQAARVLKSKEPAGWFFLSLATASQYLDRRAEANARFAEALELSRSNGWERLESFVLAHWGRSLAEERDFTRARECFGKALEIRERLQDPRAASLRRLLEALSALESGA